MASHPSLRTALHISKASDGLILMAKGSSLSASAWPMGWAVLALAFFNEKGFETLGGLFFAIDPVDLRDSLDPWILLDLGLQFRV